MGSKYGLLLRQSFHAYKMQLYIGRTDRARQKKQGLRVLKGMVCYVYGTRRGVTTDNFITSCELTNLLLTRSMTLVGTLKEERVRNSIIISQWKTKTGVFFYLWFYQWRNTRIMCTNNKQDYHPHFSMTASKRWQILKSPCTVMPLKVDLTLWTSLWGKRLARD